MRGHTDDAQGASGRSVLIVEDEARLREMLVRAVRVMGFAVRGAASGEEGLQALEQEATDVAVVDLNLPGMNGIDFCEQVRQRWPLTQMLVLTGYGDLEAAQRAIRLDVVDFLTKPCALGDLESALDRAMRRRRNHIIARAEEDGQTTVPAVEAATAKSPGGRTIEDLEREHILAALARNNGNRRATAKELGLSIRTLYYRLRVYEIRGFLRR